MQHFHIQKEVLDRAVPYFAPFTAERQTWGMTDQQLEHEYNANTKHVRTLILCK